MIRKLFFQIAVMFCFVCLAESEQFSGKVVSVTDGDTLSVLRDGAPVRVRLYGIDCPEHGQAFGENAQFATTKLCQSKIVTVEVRAKDKNDRLVGMVTLPDGKCLNHELVRRGFAWWYREFAPEDDELRELEAAAKEQTLGLWSTPAPMPPWEFRKNPQPAQAVQPTTAPSVLSPPLPERETPVVQAAPVSQGLGGAAAPPTTEVYITKTGKKYHAEGCMYLSKSKIPISLADAVAKGYTPCNVCGGGGASYETGSVQPSSVPVVAPLESPRVEKTTATSADDAVFITKTGQKYHRDGCRYLKSRIPISKQDAISKGYQPCSACKP